MGHPSSRIERYQLIQSSASDGEAAALPLLGNTAERLLESRHMHSSPCSAPFLVWGRLEKCGGAPPQQPCFGRAEPKFIPVAFLARAWAGALHVCQQGNACYCHYARPQRPRSSVSPHKWHRLLMSTPPVPDHPPCPCCPTLSVCTCVHGSHSPAPRPNSACQPFRRNHPCNRPHCPAQPSCTSLLCLSGRQCKQLKRRERMHSEDGNIFRVQGFRQGYSSRGSAVGSSPSTQNIVLV